MKKLIALVFFGVVSVTAVAHSGGTDAYGCHVDSKTGIRHCH